jgi:hypothetical protein
MKITTKVIAGLTLAIFAIIAFSNLASACRYVVGDFNGDGRFDGMDVVYAAKYFKGSSIPPYSCECPTGSGNTWFVNGDVDGSCSFSGADLTLMVKYFKGGQLPKPCPDCQPEH